MAKTLIEQWQEDPNSAIVLALRNNFNDIRNQAVFNYPQFVDQMADEADILNLIATLAQQGDMDGIEKLFTGVPINWGGLDAEQRDAIIIYGNVSPQLRRLESNTGGGGASGGGTGGTGGGTATGFDWGAVISGLTSVITGAFDAFGPGGGAPAPGSDPGQQEQKGTDLTPLVTAAKWIGGAIVLALVVWGIVKIVQSTKEAK